MDLLGKKVLVAGCGKSGLGAAGLLQKAGAVPVLFDENEKLMGRRSARGRIIPKTLRWYWEAFRRSCFPSFRWRF